MLNDAFALIPADGTFVQIGANDGLTHDPFRQGILANHWRGLLVEPQPGVYQNLVENYAAKTGRLSFENCAIGEHEGALELWRPVGYSADPRGLATQIVSADKKWVEREAQAYGMKGARIESISVPVLPLCYLLARHGLNHVDAFFIDTEGYDAIIVRQIFECYSAGQLELLPRVIVYETSGETAKDGTDMLLTSWRYAIGQDGNNTVAVRLSEDR